MNDSDSLKLPHASPANGDRRGRFVCVSTQSGPVWIDPAAVVGACQGPQLGFITAFTASTAIALKTELGTFLDAICGKPTKQGTIFGEQ